MDRLYGPLKDVKAYGLPTHLVSRPLLAGSRWSAGWRNHVGANLRYFFAAIAVATATAQANATELVGHASVIDGDTLEIHGERIRILDIDAPEFRQTCTDPQGQEWRCGQKAAFALADWIGQQTVRCSSAKLDRYGRDLARCLVGSGDMAEWLAYQGWAVPYRDCKCETIRSASEQAQAAGRGIWSSRFDLPWIWRKTHQ